VTKISLVNLNKSHAILVANNKRALDGKKNSTNTSSSFDSIVYILSHAIKMRQFWLLLMPNDMLPHIPIFHYLKYLLLLF
jgi:hypothetical protein